MLKQNPSASYGTVQHEPFDKNKIYPKKESKFALRCIIFTGIAILGFILMLVFSTNSMDSKAATDAVSHLELTSQSRKGKLAGKYVIKKKKRKYFVLSNHLFYINNMYTC